MGINDIQIALFKSNLLANSHWEELVKLVQENNFRVLRGISFSEFMMAMLEPRLTGDRYKLGHDNFLGFFCGVCPGEPGEKMGEIGWENLKHWMANRGQYKEDARCKELMVEFCGGERVALDKFFGLL